MPARSDLLFGQIAVRLGYCTADQVEACLAVQASAERPMSLGRHFVEEGFLSEAQHSEVLQQQRRNQMPATPSTPLPKSQLLFGRLVVREGYATSEELNAALREQGRPGDRRSLGEVLVARGVMTPEQVEAVLRLQQKWILRCPRCEVSLTVHSSSPNPKKAACPRCGTALEPGGTGGTAVQGEVETATLRALPRRTPVPGGACRICGHAQLGPPGPDGRVECRACRVRFVP